MLPFLRGKSDRDLSLGEGRIYLRSPVLGDWQAWSALREASREFLMPWEPSWAPDALSKASFRRRVDHVRHEWEQETGYSFLLFAKKDDCLLGGITLSNVRRGVAQTGSLGYWVGKPHARLGYMSEAIAAISRFSFDELRLNRLEAACLEHNHASRGLLVKSNFRQIGYARQYLRIAGKWQDHLLFEKLKSDD